MQVRCPTCLSAIDVAVNADFRELACPSCGRSFDFALEETVSADFQEQESLGQFLLLRLLGSGAYGEVWLARDTELDRQVAIKIPHCGVLDSRQREIFLREAQSAAQLSHPNVVGVHEIGHDGDTLYIVSEYVEGISLRDWLTDREVAPQEAALLGSKIAAGLQHLHEAGLVHRDLKPGNIMMEDGCEPRILDFGLAKRDWDETSIAVSGVVLGTPAYMSPEQARGQAHLADARSDIYSLGVVLYEFLTGQTPFRKGDDALLHRILVETPKSPRAVRPSAPRDLDTICMKCLEKDPALRYATAAEVQAELDRYLEGKPIHARRAGIVERAWRWGRRNPLAVAAISTGIVALVLCGVFVWQAYHPPQPEIVERVVPLPIPKRKVTIATEPPGARVAFVLTDDITGEPIPSSVVLVEGKGTEAVTVELPTGVYFVEAAIPDRGFHQVYRTVPREGAKPFFPYAHQRWKQEGGEAIELPTIRIRKTDELIKHMVHFPAGPFWMGEGDQPLTFRHLRDVAAFYLDPTEVTYGEARTIDPSIGVNEGVPKGDQWPLTDRSYDGAVYLAEQLGKRLPTEVEYECAATNRGVTKYPWGRDPAPLQGPDFWPLDKPVRTPPHDKNFSDPPVYGLYSGVAEWTDSGRPFYPGANPGMPDEIFYRGRVVRGGPPSLLAGKLARKECLEGARQRFMETRDRRSPGLGFRCCRSAQPQYVTQPNPTADGEK